MSDKKVDLEKFIDDFFEKEVVNDLESNFNDDEAETDCIYSEREMKLFAEMTSKDILIEALRLMVLRVKGLKMFVDGEGKPIYDQETIDNIIKHITKVKEKYCG